MNAFDLGTLAMRIALGVVFVAHGVNHVALGGRIDGTARWFESLGMRPGWLHAWTASLTELGAGVLLLVGFAVPVACAGVIGTMTVALVTNHLKNGFFIFRPGEGYEYVLTLILFAFGVSALGSGKVSIDHALGIFTPPGWAGPLLAAALGFGGAAALLAVFWRPRPRGVTG